MVSSHFRKAQELLSSRTTEPRAGTAPVDPQKVAEAQAYATLEVANQLENIVAELTALRQVLMPS